MDDSFKSIWMCVKDASALCLKLTFRAPEKLQYRGRIVSISVKLNNPLLEQNRHYNYVH